MKQLSEEQIQLLNAHLSGSELFSAWYAKQVEPSKCDGYEALSDTSKRILDLLIDRYLISLISR